ncbi:MAG: hypothetical protein CVU16_15360 [Betaproteobacteria bacterium HGW-Betaproteobacteria-10]|nr:MAG: hypothetical protein CVU16_15360 [Betaproteobacteria bacterium HGW-Betaproteobacteria-10]
MWTLLANVTQPRGQDMPVTRIVTSTMVDAAFEAQWCRLFAKCFLSSEAQAARVFRKYRLNDARLNCLFIDGNLCACYAGLVLDFADTRVLLATDTMSDGTFRRASALLGSELYEALRREGVGAVCGYPNRNIAELRKKLLFWKLAGSLHMFVGIPGLWRLRPRRRAFAPALWWLQRPPEGYFKDAKQYFRLLGRDGLYGESRLGLVFTLSAARPGPFFVRVPGFIFAPRNFGYRVLAEGDQTRQIEQAIVDALPRLDLETIDVP